MPKLEAKQVQKELEKGLIWPVYWFYGNEGMKSRELLRRIRKSVIGEGVQGFAEEILEGGSVSAAEVCDSAHSLTLGGGVRLVVIRDAHLIKESESFATLLGPPAERDQLPCVCVFLAKDLDGRKKFSKLLLEKAAVVSCEAVPEAEREAWIRYLARRKGIELQASDVLHLSVLDPWGLDIVDQELEKYSLALLGADGADQASDVFLTAWQGEKGGEAFLDAFFARDLARAMKTVGTFADSLEESLPLLGLLAWNVRHLALSLVDQEKGTHSLKLGSFLSERFGRWSRHWTLREVECLQSELSLLDFGIKQTFRIPVGLWSVLVMKFCLV